MVAESQRVIARTQGKTDTTEGSVVQCTAKLGIRLTLRWFPADSTAVLERQNALGDSKSLNALPFFIGKLEGGKLEALDPKKNAPLRLPSPEKQLGRLEKGCFLAADKLLIQQFRAAPADFKAQGWHEVNLHQIVLSNLPAGITVGICIGVDSKSRFRRYPLWSITIGDNDAVLDIFETYGRNASNDKATSQLTHTQGTASRNCTTDYYSGRLTGNIWLRSTHPFTPADVDALTLDQVTPAMKTALKKIYAGGLDLQGSNFALDIPHDESGLNTVRFYWQAGDNANCRDNISGVDLRADVPVRVHPAAYAAAARAAFEAKVKQIDLSSSWRPMLGSMGHRNGLALDMNWLRGAQVLHLNRDGLTRGQQKDTISQEEQDAYKEMEEAEKELAIARRSGSQTQIESAIEAEVAAKRQWARAVEKNQPTMLNSFRNALLEAKPLVSQVLDPWYMERNSRDSQPPIPNQQKDDLEKLHRHHLHITIQDPELTP